MHAVAAVTCACSAAVGAWHPAAIALRRGQFQVAALNHHIQPADRKLRDDAQARLDRAVAAGEFTAEQLAMRKTEGETMSLDELAEFVQTALDEVKPPLAPRTNRPKPKQSCCPPPLPTVLCGYTTYYHWGYYYFI